MKKLVQAIVFSCGVLLFGGCASIMNNNPESFNLVSEPSSAKVIVKDVKADTIVLQNHTPFSITLEKKHGFFSGKEYLVNVSKAGFKDVSFAIKPSVSGWYIGGNLIFGGLIGYLIVDPATGAMWNLVPEKHEQVSTDKQIITVKLLSDLSESEQAKLRVSEPIIK
ncbi:hypothetical protein [Campylobacter suis]|uniref:Lipoprotein n=1 Tax=Campylobacter suis TaxID=2790657 RepID=A0ABN7KAT5_9BACT|nr:hypothetical protein [Campylobacter suis]CAD7287995.1 hypothetical protein LMG8286_01073 [Campylobacter suis]